MIFESLMKIFLVVDIKRYVIPTFFKSTKTKHEPDLLRQACPKPRPPPAALAQRSAGVVTKQLADRDILLLYTYR